MMLAYPKRTRSGRGPRPSRIRHSGPPHVTRGAARWPVAVRCASAVAGRAAADSSSRVSTHATSPPGGMAPGRGTTLCLAERRWRSAALTLHTAHASTSVRSQRCTDATTRTQTQRLATQTHSRRSSDLFRGTLFGELRLRAAKDEALVDAQSKDD